MLEQELFCFCAESVELPVSVKFAGNITTFHCKLKTHLFKLACPPQLLSVPIQLFTTGTTYRLQMAKLLYCIMMTTVTLNTNLSLSLLLLG